jgi:hypothetical protein
MADGHEEDDDEGTLEEEEQLAKEDDASSANEVRFVHFSGSVLLWMRMFWINITVFNFQFPIGSLLTCFWWHVD